MFENEIPGTTDTGVQPEATAGQPEATVTESVNQPGESIPEQTFTKSQVNDLMKKRVQRSHNAFFTRYGVKDLNELDNLFSQAALYKDVESKYNELLGQHQDLTKRYGYKACNIDEQKINDIETYFKGKGIDISEETLREELKTHPDWVHKIATIQQLGAEVTMPTEADQRAEASKIFGVKL